MITISENMGRSQKVRLKSSEVVLKAYGSVTVRESEITPSLDYKVKNGYLTLVKEPETKSAKPRTRKRGKTLNE